MLGFDRGHIQGGNHWRLTVDADGQEFVRERLSSLRFEKYVEWIIRQMGADHRHLAGNHPLLPFDREVYHVQILCGIGRQAGLRNDVMRVLMALEVN